MEREYNFKEITKKKERLDSFRPLSYEILRSLKTLFDLQLTYNSNAIEGNTLDIKETKLILDEGITIGGKTLKEHLEVINHKEALDYIENLVSKQPHQITEQDTLGIHSLILRGIQSKDAGKYRNVPVRISGSRVAFPNPLKVPELMKELFRWLSTPSQEHPIKLSSDAHYRLVTIHPFIDGNGRVARLLLNLILIQNGYPPALIKKEERKDYIDSLESAQLGGSLEKFYRLVTKAVDRSIDIYLEAIDKKIHYS